MLHAIYFKPFKYYYVLKRKKYSSVFIQYDLGYMKAEQRHLEFRYFRNPNALRVIVLFFRGVARYSPRPLCPTPLQDRARIFSI